MLVIAASGWFDSQTRTVTVEAPVVPITTPSANEKYELTAHEIYDRDAPGVVFITATGVSISPSTAEIVKGEGGEQGTSTGSGFEIDGAGMILTNWHVVENAIKVRVTIGGKTVEAHVVGKDPSLDLAVLRIPTEGLTLRPLTLGRSSVVEVGEPVLAIGDPFGYTSTLTTGIVSSVQRQIQAPNGATINGAMQTDVPLDPGSSGGPLLNTQGEVIGINSQIVSLGGGGGDVGISFSIPIDPAVRELASLRQ